MAAEKSVQSGDLSLTRSLLSATPTRAGQTERNGGKRGIVEIDNPTPVKHRSDKARGGEDGV